MDYTVFIILGVLALVYFVVLFSNRKSQRKRKSRRFMEGKQKHEE